MVEQRAVGGQEGASDLDGLRVPLLRLVCLNFHVELLKAAHLFLQLNNETNLSADAKVAYTEETDSFQERKPVQLLLVASKRSQIFKLNWSYLHDVANVKGQNPLALVQKAKHVAHISHLNLALALLRSIHALPFLSFVQNFVVVEQVIFMKADLL